MSRWLPVSSAPKDSVVVDLWCAAEVAVPFYERITDCYFCRGEWRKIDRNGRTWRLPKEFSPTHFMYRPEPPSDTDALDAQLSPESLADVQAGRQVCRAIYTGLAEVASLESLKPKE